MTQRRTKRYRVFKRAYGDHRETDARARRATAIGLLATLAVVVGVILSLGLWIYERSRADGEAARRAAEAPTAPRAASSQPDSAAAPESAPEEVLIN